VNIYKSNVHVVALDTASETSAEDEGKIFLSSTPAISISTFVEEVIKLEEVYLKKLEKIHGPLL
jgi:hypothetical protein